MSSISTQWRSFFSQIRTHQSQLVIALRVTAAALLSFVLAEVSKVPLPLWTVLTAVVLTQASFGRSVKATIDYLVGTLCGAIYAGAVAVLFPATSDIALTGALALVAAPLALIAAINPTFSVAPFTGVLVLMIPGITHAAPIESAFFRVIEVAIGGLAAVAVSLFVLPTRAYMLVIEAAAQMLGLMARLLSELLSSLMQSGNTLEIAHIQQSIGQATARLDDIATQARHERVGFFGGAPSLLPLLRTLSRLRHDLVMMGRAAAVPLPPAFRQQFGPQLTQVMKTVADYLQQSGEALATRRGPPSLEAANAALDAYARGFAESRRQGITQDLAVEAVERIFTLGLALDLLRQNLRDLERCVTEAARWR
jgi:uncharacterized membrane protein YccC